MHPSGRKPRTVRYRSSDRLDRVSESTCRPYCSDRTITSLHGYITRTPPAGRLTPVEGKRWWKASRHTGWKLDLNIVVNFVTPYTEIDDTIHPGRTRHGVIASKPRSCRVTSADATRGKLPPTGGTQRVTERPNHPKPALRKIRLDQKIKLPPLYNPLLTLYS